VGTSMIIVSPDEALHLDRETFEREAVARFGIDALLLPDADDPTADVSVTVQRADEPSFRIFHAREANHISIEGNECQQAETALWVRSLLLDDPGGRIWLVDQGYSGHVELVPGMSEADLDAGWVEHDGDEPEG
jgi:hypothetical protein